MAAETTAVAGQRGSYGLLVALVDSGLLQADGDYVWCTTRNDDDLPSIVRYRIVPPFRE